MERLKRLLGWIDLDPASTARLKRWRSLQPAALTTPFHQSRYVVVDVESTGLDLNRDRLIAIGAVAVVEGRIVLADSFEGVLRQEQVSDRDNILIHGIGAEAQREGDPPVTALLDFLDYLGSAPLVAFHVTFDATLMGNALKHHLGLKFRRSWLDLAYLMPALLPDYAARYHSLDEWAHHFHLTNYARHSALADALVTAQLLLCSLPLATAQQAHHYQSLVDLERLQRWRQGVA